MKFLIVWLIISLCIGIITFFEDDHKFGTHNIQIAGLMFVFTFFSPILLPCIWIMNYIDNRKIKDIKNDL